MISLNTFAPYLCTSHRRKVTLCLGVDQIAYAPSIWGFTIFPNPTRRRALLAWYHDRMGGLYIPNENLAPWTRDEIGELKIEEITESQSFLFLWCGETHLEDGRALFKKWGFRRIEDLCWVKTNRKVKQVDGNADKTVLANMSEDISYMARTKEHCLMGIKGTVKRSEDFHLIHANVWKEPQAQL